MSQHQVLLEDLTFVIDVILVVTFVTAVHLVRQRIVTVAALAHAFSVIFLVLAVGHYIETHVIGLDGVQDLVRRGPRRRGFAAWSRAGILSAATVMALAARFWNCDGVAVDCVVGDAAPIHYRCKMSRLRIFAPVFTVTVVFVYLCISSRLNAVLGGSVLHPRDGGYALAVLANPTLVSVMCVSGCVSVWLYFVLTEAQHDHNGTARAAESTSRLPRYGCLTGSIVNAWEGEKTDQIQAGGVSGSNNIARAALHSDQEYSGAHSVASIDSLRSYRVSSRREGKSIARSAMRRRADRVRGGRAQAGADSASFGLGEKEAVVAPPAPASEGGIHRKEDHDAEGVGAGGVGRANGPAHALDELFLPFPGGSRGRETGHFPSRDGTTGTPYLPEPVNQARSSCAWERSWPPRSFEQDGGRFNPPRPRSDDGLMTAAAAEKRRATGAPSWGSPAARGDARSDRSSVSGVTRHASLVAGSSKELPVSMEMARRHLADAMPAGTRRARTAPEGPSLQVPPATTVQNRGMSLSGRRPWQQREEEKEQAAVLAGRLRRSGGGRDSRASSTLGGGWTSSSSSSSGERVSDGDEEDRNDKGGSLRRQRGERITRHSAATATGLAQTAVSSGSGRGRGGPEQAPIHASSDPSSAAGGDYFLAGGAGLDEHNVDLFRSRPVPSHASKTPRSTIASLTSSSSSSGYSSGSNSDGSSSSEDGNAGWHGEDGWSLVGDRSRVREGARRERDAALVDTGEDGGRYFAAAGGQRQRLAGVGAGARGGVRWRQGWAV